MRAVAPILGLAPLLALHSALAASEIPAEDEYAFRFPVRIEQPAEFLAVEIPLEVYRSVSDPRLRDLGVYNTAGQAVPRMVEGRQERPRQVERETPLGMVPLYGGLEASGERLRLLMQRNEAGTTLQFDSRLPRPAAEGLQLQAVIVDLRDGEDTFAALDFDWSAPAGFIGLVIVEDGDDLASWRRLARGTLAELEYEGEFEGEFEGTRIVRDRMELPREPGDFLRITWRNMPQGWRLKSVTGISRDHGPDETRQWLDLSPAEVADNGREFIFDAGGYPPVDRVNLLLPGGNVALRASVEYRHGPESAWRSGHEGLFYNISRGGDEIASDPARLSPSRASQWRVRILSGQADGDVRLHLGWRPERLLFLAQGEPPFTLASGRARDRIEGFPQDRMLGDSGIFAMLEESGEAGRASVGARQVGAGATVMEGARTWTWRTVLVWIGLIAAVLVVGWLVWSLMRESK